MPLSKKDLREFSRKICRNCKHFTEGTRICEEIEKKIRPFDSDSFEDTGIFVSCDPEFGCNLFKPGKISYEDQEVAEVKQATENLHKLGF